MKKFNFIVSLLMAIVCSVGIARAAERVAPTLPEAKTLESGKEYYLYNVGSRGFLAPLSTDQYRSGIDQPALKVTITMTSDACYYISTSNGETFQSNSDGHTDFGSSNVTDEYGVWDFISTDNANEYYIKTASSNEYYNANNYVGLTNGGKEILHNLSLENNVVWRLIEANEETELLCAKRLLYNTLSEMDVKGYYIDPKYEEIYANESCTVSDLNDAASYLISSVNLSGTAEVMVWNDYPVFYETSGDKWTVSYSSNNRYFISTPKANSTATLSATVVVDEDATFSFSFNNHMVSNSGNSLKVYVDGVETHSYAKEQLNAYYQEYHFIELTPGKHTIEWVGICTNEHCQYVVCDVGVEKTPTITVTLLEPGSLGTEVLYNVNHLKDVRKLKVIGKMNDDDLAKIAMMKDNLYTLDLSEAVLKEIPDNYFGSYNEVWPYLHSVALPEGLQRIGEYAFAYSYIDTEIPSTIESIGEYAFYGSFIREAMLPEKCLTLGNNIFGECIYLTKAQLPEALTTIPWCMFMNCYFMEIAKLPSNLESVGDRAFSNCYNVSPDLPESLTEIGNSAFENTNLYGTKTDLIIPKNVSFIGYDAFKGCGYSYVELSTNFYCTTANNILSSSVKTIKLNSATVVSNWYYDGYSWEERKLLNDDWRAGIDLIVPSHLVNAYKLHDYWYNFKSITGFSTETIDEWAIGADLILGARDRLLGTPSITVLNTGSLKINGEDGMPINNLYLNVNPRAYYDRDTNYSRIISNVDGVTIAGELTTCFELENTGFWYYLCLPYDVKVGDINNGLGGLCAARYYDGASRATNGATGNWKNYDSDAIISAGTGFIIQVNTTGSWYFPAQDNESKQYVTSNKVFAKGLAENASENASDRGWNLIGNPYQCWYNIHKLNFTAPITVRNRDGQYEAYSVIDDDYAIAPNQAFFVQRPSEITTILFPLDGRQMTSVITDQNNTPSVNTQTPSRFLTDIIVSNETETDRTRVVLNEKATALYDMGCDANKFMAENTNVPQIYTIDKNGTQYAINERPVADGVVRLGFRSNGGTFVFSLGRNMSEKVILIDNETGQETDLTEQDYSFIADATTYDNRFELHFYGAATGIDHISGEKPSISITDGGISITNAIGAVEVFNANGVKVASVSGNANIQLSAGVYVVKTAGHVKKVVVK